MKALLDRAINEKVFRPPGLGCVLCLPGSPGGSHKIYDRSPYGNHGTITGATWKRLPSGLWYLYYDGTDDKVTIGHNASLNTASYLTIETWFYCVTATHDGVILDKKEVSGSSYRLFIDGGARRIAFVCDGLTDARINSSVDSLVDGNWYHVVSRYDSSALKIFINGIEDGSDTSTGSISTNTNDLTLGIENTGSGSFLLGSLALLRIYNRALSNLEILNHFDQEKHLFGVW